MSLTFSFFFQAYIARLEEVRNKYRTGKAMRDGGDENIKMKCEGMKHKCGGNPFYKVLNFKPHRKATCTLRSGR